MLNKTDITEYIKITFEENEIVINNEKIEQIYNKFYNFLVDKIVKKDICLIEDFDKNLIFEELENYLKFEEGVIDGAEG